MVVVTFFTFIIKSKSNRDLMSEDFTLLALRYAVHVLVSLLLLLPLSYSLPVSHWRFTVFNQIL